MRIAKTVPELLLAKKEFPLAPVLVPTMGALHEGHLALVEKARSIAGPNGCVAVSIFINPIQFNNQSDLENYPNPIEQDLELCKKHGVDLVFTPSPEILYAHNRSILISETSLSNKLCGATRPGHFDGVCTVVAKLFNLFTPTDAVFGKKDYQQLAIINRLVRDLNFPVIIHGVDTVREQDGLALSSRNLRLSPESRNQAPIIYQALKAAKENLIETKDASTLLASIKAKIETETPQAVIDYLECVDASTLQPVSDIDRKCIVAIAVFLGDVRLIDNIELVPQT